MLIRDFVIFKHIINDIIDVKHLCCVTDSISNSDVTGLRASRCANTKHKAQMYRAACKVCLCLARRSNIRINLQHRTVEKWRRSE